MGLKSDTEKSQVNEIREELVTSAGAKLLARIR